MLNLANDSKQRISADELTAEHAAASATTTTSADVPEVETVATAEVQSADATARATTPKGAAHCRLHLVNGGSDALRHLNYLASHLHVLAGVKGHLGYKLLGHLGCHLLLSSKHAVVIFDHLFPFEQRHGYNFG
jgi:hypothetical protein